MANSMKRKIAVIAIATVATTGSIAGALAASAKSQHRAKPISDGAVWDNAATVDGDSIQSGDQNTPDATRQGDPDTQDGPGGWQDPPGANVNNDQQGSN
jgi:hypothetical protein